MNSPALQILPLLVANGWLALEASIVEEVIGEMPITRVPSATPELIGVLAWRGRVVAVVDLAGIVGGEFDADSPRTIIVSVGDDTLAFCVTAAREVILVETVRPSHVARIPFSSLETELDGVAIPIFDPEQWLASLRVGS